MEYTYRTKGVCSQQMEIETDGDIITHVNIIGGCNGNGQGVARLVEQLAQALKIMKARAAEAN